MKPQIIVKNLKIDQHTHRYVMNRLRLALDRLLLKVGGITVRLTDVNGPRGGIDKTCQINLTVPGHKPIVVTERSVDLLAAIDRATHVAARSLSRMMKRDERLLRRRKGAAALPAAAAETAADLELDLELDDGLASPA
ncbi:HPF/RaiA family ribosome-associated protein [Chitinilyticum litopenaei]|uniref:HPF/RaiA family ribosome-associated protein n=1 Tax=Chitinilyticum litopenaei TaxID=1121276 RepID=UPI00042289E3|nr:HPF/RaiA family ribosome-associated protein [Chitinilyticum litopenaei]